jgi:hypothetical protein
MPLRVSDQIMYEDRAAEIPRLLSTRGVAFGQSRKGGKGSRKWKKSVNNTLFSIRRSINANPLRLPDQLQVFVRLDTLSFITAHQQAALSPQIGQAVSVNES